jgi:SAM-dependent methyltransferase
MKIRYLHNEFVHNLNDPKIIIPYILGVLNPSSVIDIGCGTGTFLKICKQFGINKVTGIDGPWVDKNLLSENLNISEFIELNLEEGFRINSRYDLALCLEVAEHLTESSSDLFIKCLVECSDVVLFSAAVPGQKGQNHINEQWPEYWERKFKLQNYSFNDVIRPIFWDEENLSLWYRQNMFIATNKNKEAIVYDFKKNVKKEIINIVHPQYYSGKVAEIEELEKNMIEYKNKEDHLLKGKARFSIYIKMILKYFLRKLKLYNK